MDDIRESEQQTLPTTSFKLTNGRLLELTFQQPNCAAVIKLSDGKIEDQFVFLLNEVGRKHQFMLGAGWFTIRDVNGHPHKYRLEDGESEKINEWYLGFVNEEIKKQWDMEVRNREQHVEFFREHTGVSDMLEFVESEFREGFPGFSTSETRSSYIYVANATDALFLLHECECDIEHPLFPSAIRRVEYKDCQFLRGTGNSFFAAGAFMGTLASGRLFSQTCYFRLLLRDGELLLSGNKKDVHILEIALKK